MPAGATITSVEPPYLIGSAPVTLEPGQEIVVELDFDGDSPDNCGVFEWTYAGGAIAVSTDGGPSATITGVGIGEASVRVVDEMDRTVLRWQSVSCRSRSDAACKGAAWPRTAPAMPLLREV